MIPQRSIHAQGYPGQFLFTKRKDHQAPEGDTAERVMIFQPLSLFIPVVEEKVFVLSIGKLDCGK
jgi:hypothetical protein